MVYNINGRVVDTVYVGHLPEGFHNIQWNAAHLPSGTYYIQLLSRDNQKTIKTVLLK